jgi:cell division protein FtsI (penicillin-binding protein 3)
MRPRLIAFFVVVLIVIGVVVIRVGALQTLDAKQLTAYGATQRRDRESLPASRGIIFDRNHEELALSVERPSVWADPRAIVDKGATVTALASALNLSPSDMRSLRDRLDTDAEFVYVARTVEQPIADAVAALDLKGIYFVGEPKRFLPADSLAKGVIGTTDSFGAGSSGLEKQYDGVLTGTPGQLIREQDSRGRTIPQGQHEIVPAQPGDDLVLTLDRTLQYFTEQQLLQRVRDTHAKGGMVVVLDTKTGDVLAMASVKTDPTTGMPSIATYNAAVVDTYEPGSVAKIITASAALQEGTITPNQIFTVPWFMKFADDVISDAEPHPIWALNVKGILVHSSNIGTALITRTMTRQTQEKYMRAFGLGEPTGLDFPGESRGILAPAGKWWGSQRVTVAYGQGVAVTAVQLASAMNTIANGGNYVAPRLVDATIDRSGQEHVNAPSSGRAVLSSTVADEMTGILTGVVCEGNGGKAQIPGYTVAGKTGTAYKAQDNGTYLDSGGNKHYYASFAGYVPAEDPRLTILASIDEPELDVHFGALAAAPLFSDVAQQALRQFNVPPSADGGGCPAPAGKGG